MAGGAPAVEASRPPSPEAAKPAAEAGQNPNAGKGKNAVKANGGRWSAMNPERLLNLFATKKEPPAVIHTGIPKPSAPDAPEPVAAAAGPKPSEAKPAALSPEDKLQKAEAKRQREAFREIGGIPPKGLGYTVAADTDPAMLLVRLVKEKGWQPDMATADRVRDAVNDSLARIKDPDAAAKIAAKIATRDKPASEAQQQKAFDEINPIYEITAETDPAVLYAQLVKDKGWEINQESADYVKAAVDKMKPPAATAPETPIEATQTLAEAPAVNGEPTTAAQTAEATTGQEAPAGTEIQQLTTELASLKTELAEAKAREVAANAREAARDIRERQVHGVVTEMAQQRLAEAKTEKDKLTIKDWLLILGGMFVEAGLKTGEAELNEQAQAA